jgi:hypothetical protein
MTNLRRGLGATSAQAHSQDQRRAWIGSPKPNFFLPFLSGLGSERMAGCQIRSHHGTCSPVTPPSSGQSMMKASGAAILLSRFAHLLISVCIICMRISRGSTRIANEKLEGKGQGSRVGHGAFPTLRLCADPNEVYRSAGLTRSKPSLTVTRGCLQKVLHKAPRLCLH